MKIARPAISVMMIPALAAVALAPLAEDRPVLPHISDLQIAPDSGPRGTPYIISLRIADPQGSADIVGVLYLRREQSELILVEINDDGVGADRVAGDGIYTGHSVVPDTAASGVHRFQLFVRDRDGHQSNILQYRFTVESGSRLIPL